MYSISRKILYPKHHIKTLGVAKRARPAPHLARKNVDRVVPSRKVIAG